MGDWWGGTHLECEFASVAQDDGLDCGVLLLVAGLNLLQHAQHKDSGLTHTRLGLAEDVHTQDGLGDALVLDCAHMRAGTTQ